MKKTFIGAMLALALAACGGDDTVAEAGRDLRVTYSGDSCSLSGGEAAGGEQLLSIRNVSDKAVIVQLGPVKAGVPLAEMVFTGPLVEEIQTEANSEQDVTMYLVPGTYATACYTGTDRVIMGGRFEIVP